MRSHWEQILSFKRSSYFEKGRNWIESLLNPVVSLWCAYLFQRSDNAIVLSYAFVCLFDLILYVQSTICQLYRDGSSWVEPVLSYDECVLLKDHNAVTPVRLEPAAFRSQSYAFKKRKRIDQVSKVRYFVAIIWIQTLCKYLSAVCNYCILNLQWSGQWSND